MSGQRLERIQRGRTDLVWELLATGQPATTSDADGVALIQWAAYYGDVSAIRFLLGHGETLQRLGDNFDLYGAAFHGHWRLCQFLLEQGADVDRALPDTGELPLHAALCASDRPGCDLVLRVLLQRGANPNRTTLPNRPTGSFMRDARTRGETPLHRAAAFGSESAVQLLLQAGADLEARDMHGDTPLAWASWHLRPDPILRLLCYGSHRIHPNRRTMAENLLGEPRQ